MSHKSSLPCSSRIAVLSLVVILFGILTLAVPPANAQSGAPTATVKGASLNVRSGPGTSYPVIASVKKGQTFEIKGKNQDGTWLQLCCFKSKNGWASASLVTVKGDLKTVPVAKDIPPAPAAKAPAKAATAKGGSALKGALLYSVANMDANRWEMWEYDFASKASRFLKEWRTEVAFAPDYKHAVYFAWPGAVGDKAGIYMANPDLSDERLVIEGGAYPSYSADGSRFSAQGGDTMYVLNADGGGLRPLADGEYPDWSPIDNWIAHRGCYGPDCGLWLTHADSGERRRLTTGGGDGQPIWSPDGQQIAYISKDDGNFEIYKVNRDGSNKVRLTNVPQSDGLPVWSPDGKWIAFRSDRSGKWAIYVMPSAGGDATKLVDADVLPVWFFEKMAWRP